MNASMTSGVFVDSGELGFLAIALRLDLGLSVATNPAKSAGATLNPAPAIARVQPPAVNCKTGPRTLNSKQALDLYRNP